MAPFRDSLHLQTRLILRDLPANARILCVGVGTGAELVALARQNPGWHFLASDPSEPMLEVCRQRATQEGIADRCEFRAAYVEALPAGARFDAATALLVSHFLPERNQRVAFFREILSRLHPNGILVSADLSIGPLGQHENLLGVWQQMMRLTGATEEQIKATLVSYTREVSLLTLPEMEALLIEAGFHAPVHFAQTLLIHAWYSRRPDDTL